MSFQKIVFPFVLLLTQPTQQEYPVINGEDGLVLQRVLST